jgi:hypothetical protein
MAVLVLSLSPAVVQCAAPPSPFPQPDTLVGVGLAFPKLGQPLAFREVLSGPEYLDVKEGGVALERVGGERVTWQRINERPGAQSIAACGNGRLYALHKDGTLASTDGTRSAGAWQPHGRLTNAARIACAGTTLYYLSGNRELFDLRAPAGTASVPAARRLGRPYAAAHLGAAVNGSLAMPWVLNDDSTLWPSTKAGVAGQWVRVGPPGSAARVAGAPGRVFVLNRDRTLWISETGRDGSWRLIDQPRSAAEITATARGNRESATVYALNDDGSLWRGSVVQ